MELLRFGNSGTECVQYALRFARAFTGREKILRFEGHYHGWSDAIHWSGHPGPGEWGPAEAPAAVRRLDRDARGRRGHADRGHLERRRRPRARLRGARLRDRRGDHRADPRQLRRHHAGARLPRAHARARHRARRGADLRRGADRDARRARRGAGALRHPPRPDRAGEGPGRRRPGGRGRRPQGDHGDGDRRAHHARRHLQLESARVLRRDRDGGRDRRAGLLHGARGARPAARRWPGGPGRRRGPRGLLERHRRDVPALVRPRAAGRLPAGARRRRHEPVPDALRRAARARRPDPAAAGGAVLPLRRAHRRRRRPHARGGGRGDAGGCRRRRAAAMSGPRGGVR